MKIMFRIGSPVFVLAIAFLFPNRSYAVDDSLVIGLKGGQVVTIAVSNIQKITFENVSSSVNVSQPSGNGLNVTGNYPNPSDNPNVVSMIELQPGVTTGDRLMGDNTPGVWGGPAYYNGPNGQIIFYCADEVTIPRLPGNLNAFLIENGTLIREGTSKESFPNGGASPVVSSNQQANGIVWAVQRGDSSGAPNLSLCAYNAATLSRHGVAPNLLAKLPSLGTWQVGRAFIEPTVINGKVYVAFLDSSSTQSFVGVFF